MSNLVTTRQGFAPVTFTEARQFAEELASSSLVPKAYTGKPQDILVAMQWGAEIGLAHCGDHYRAARQVCQMAACCHW